MMRSPTRFARAIRTLPERTPLRITLVAAVLVLVTLALAITGAAGTLMLRGYLLDRVDSQLYDTAATTRQRVLREGRLPTQDPGGYQLATSAAFYVQYNTLEGSSTSFMRSRSANQHEPALPTLDADTANRYADRPFTVRANGSGHAWRVLVTRLPGDAGSITVGTSLDDVDDTVGRLAFLEATIGAAVLVVLAVVGYAMVRSSLRRLAEVEQTAQAIAAGDLTKRVPPGDPNTEVGRLAAAFNRMVAEIETAFRARTASEAEARGSEARMRRFVADASHELRTPLTAIRGFAELHRQGGRDLTTVDHLFERIEHHAKRMGLLVDDLLLLARLDQHRPLEQRPVDLLAVATDAVSDATVTANEHPVRLQTAGTEPAVVLGDEARLRQVLANLLSNAVVHTPPGTEVTVTVATTPDTAELAVTDTGPGLSEQDAARVFERFYRTDPARSRAHGGTGLGLSIVAAIVAAHGGEVRVASAPGAGARFEVTLPRYRPPGD
jgi:two-component system, OmpR family, sensor kinase